jgi:hypothetical protein
MPWSSDNLRTAANVAAVLVAFAALFRPDIGRFIQRRRASIDVHPAGRVEIGFSTFGPTVGLQGTLQAIHRDAFVARSRVTIERVVDHLRHDFQWAVFRTQALFATGQQTEIAAGFLLSVAAPRRFNIQFHDTETADNFRQSLIALQKLWMDYLKANSIVLSDLPGSQIRNAYTAFSEAKLAEITPLHQTIDRQFYWIPGTYSMRLEVQITRPTKLFAWNYDFTLTQADSDILRLNAIACLLATCNVPDVIFNFAYPTY